MLSNKLKIVILAVIFNLLFEYSIRGFKGLFLHQGLILFLFLLYFCYFLIVDSLIRKYRITNIQLLIVAFCFGTLIVTFFTGNIFVKPTLLGVNIPRFFFINIVWWGFIQALLTFYFANRIVKRDWNEKAISKLSWLLCLAYIIGLPLFIFLIKTSPNGSLTGYIFSLIFLLFGLLYLKKKLKKPQQPAYQFKKILFLDILAFGTVIAFFIIGSFVATTQTNLDDMAINLLALRLSKAWTILVFVGMIIYYLKGKKPITI